MNKLLLNTLIILIFFTACGQPNKLAYYKQNKAQTNYPEVWQTLLLLPEEYLPNSGLKHYVHPPYMSQYQKSNPGFIDLKSFKDKHSKHPLSQLNLWYSASFFLNNTITHYMIMEFQNEQKAKNYISHLQSNETQKVNKILRYKSILFSFTLRDFNNALLDYSSHPEIDTWIKHTIKGITQKL